MSKRSKRAKRERELDNLAALRMKRALLAEKQRNLRCLISIEIDESRADKLQSVQSAVRKWERRHPDAKVNIGTHLSPYEG